MAMFTSRKQNKDVKVSFQGDMLFVAIDGGKPQAYPLTWMPLLKNASADDQADWRLTENGIRWDNLNIEISLR